MSTIRFSSYWLSLIPFFIFPFFICTSCRSTADDKENHYRKLLSLADFDDAVNYIKRAIRLRKDLNMSRETAGALQNLGIVYRRA